MPKCYIPPYGRLLLFLFFSPSFSVFLFPPSWTPSYFNFFFFGPPFSPNIPVARLSFSLFSLSSSYSRNFSEILRGFVSIFFYFLLLDLLFFELKSPFSETVTVPPFNPTPPFFSLPLGFYSPSMRNDFFHCVKLVTLGADLPSLIVRSVFPFLVEFP